MSVYEYANFNRSLTVREGQVGHADKSIVGIKVRDSNEAEAFVTAEDAPAVALAILEAAGVGADSTPAVLDAAHGNLRRHVETQKRYAEQEAKEQKVRDFYQVQGIILREVDDLHVFRYNAARKFFEGS